MIKITGQSFFSEGQHNKGGHLCNRVINGGCVHTVCYHLQNLSG